MAVVYNMTFLSDLSKKEEVMQFTRSKCIGCKMLVDKGKEFQHYAHQHMKEEEVPFQSKCGGRFNSLSISRGITRASQMRRTIGIQRKDQVG